MQVTKDTTIGELLDLDVNTAQFLLEMGMHCIGCPSSIGETLEEACMVHNANCNQLVEKINAYLASK